MTFTKIPSRSTLVPQIVDQLRKAILRGKLGPGARLNETHVAESLGVSRTPVREAISRLLAQGLVKEAGGGVKVVADMMGEIHEIFAIRQVLEGFAARLAAEQATSEEFSELEQMCQASLAAVDSTSVAERAALNNIFHSSIAKASHSNRLIKIIREFYEYAIQEEVLPFYGPDAARTQFEQHLEILDALRARDADRAEAAMRRHIGDVRLHAMTDLLPADDNSPAYGAVVDFACTSAFHRKLAAGLIHLNDCSQLRC